MGLKLRHSHQSENQLNVKIRPIMGLKYSQQVQQSSGPIVKIRPIMGLKSKKADGTVEDTDC